MALTGLLLLTSLVLIFGGGGIGEPRAGEADLTICPADVDPAVGGTGDVVYPLGYDPIDYRNEQTTMQFSDDSPNEGETILIKPFSEAVNNLLFADDLLYENIRFYNLSGLFNAIREPLFIDWCHVGEYGNELISERMVRDMLPVIDSLKAGNEFIDE